MEIIWYGFLFVSGAVIGSFLNVLIDRVPAHQSLIMPPSHCPHCNQNLKVKDLFPIASYLLLKGKCRYCKTRIPLRILLVEIATGFLFMFLFWFYGFNWNVLLLSFYGCLFIVLSVIDLEQGILPNMILYSVAIFVILLSVFQYFSIINIMVPGIISAAIGFSIGFVFFLILALIYKGGMGFGDVKLAGLIGLMTGFPMVFMAIFITAFIGGLAAIVLLVSKAKGRKDAVPFGPFLCIGAMAALLWGTTIITWYLSGR